MLDSNGPLLYDNNIKKYITIQSFLNENIEGNGKKKFLADVRLCKREDYEKVGSGEVWDDLQASGTIYNELCVDNWENASIWGIKKMTSFADYRIRVIGCVNKTFNN